MPKFTVTLIGNVKIERDIVVIAPDEDSAAQTAEEILEDNLIPTDEIDLSDVYVENYKEPEIDVFARAAH